MTVGIRRFAFLASAGLGLLLAPASQLFASGFALDSQGARAMGFAGAYVAQSADPSAIFYNAAGVGFLKGKHLSIGGTLAGLSTDFTGAGAYPAAGTVERTDSGLKVLPTLYYTQQVSDTVVVGLGVNAPFGFHSSWQKPDQFTGRFICLDCEIQSWAVNPTLAFKLADRLAVGAGVDIRLSSFHLTRRLLPDPNPFTPNLVDVAEAKMDSGWKSGVGFNVGLLASPSESVSIGVAYRHRVAVKYDGTASFRQILTGNVPVDEAVQTSLPAPQAMQTAINFPASVAGGIAVRRGYWTVEGDFVWTFWSTFDRVDLTFPDTPALDSTLVQAYRDTWAGRIGVEYLIADTWEVRGGYTYDHGPQHSETVSPFLHDSNRHGFALGASWKHELLRLDLVARYLLYRPRATDGLSQYDYEGTYQSHSLAVGLSLGYRF
jgi:long-chain fatty acid transport protein